MTALTAQIAAQAVAYDSGACPDDVQRMAQLCVIDHLGCVIRGAAEPLSQMLAEELFDGPQPGEAFLPAKRQSRDLAQWAMLQGATAHAIDFDDTFFPGRAAHAGASVVGSALTLAPTLGADGPTLLSAVVAGYETAARVAHLVTDAHYEQGFHPTGTVGVFAATAACCRLMALSPAQTEIAMGLAATQAAGLKSTFGTMAKPFNAGRAASNGVLAARLAARGFTANAAGLEADKGYLDLFLGHHAAARSVDGPERFWILGNAFKLHAACHALHPLIEAIGRLRAEHGIGPDDVERLEVSAAALSLKTASIGEPTSGLESKFSFTHAAAVALAGLDTASDETFSDAILADERIRALRRLTQVIEAPIEPFGARVSIETKAGDQLTKEIDLRDLLADLEAVGAQVEAKFLQNATPSLGAARAARTLETILALSETADISAAFA
ncbi:MAG: MmgE/PrpD family protein [Pseudomonadota bacterium]